MQNRSAGRKKKINIIIKKEHEKDPLLMKAVTDVLSARKWIVPTEQAKHILTQTYSYL